MSETHDRLKRALGERYSIERELGHGGMATVHLARDLRYDRVVAIKVLRPELAQALGGARFLREINIAAKLQSPHILPLLDSGEADGLLYYVMPYVEGDSLRGLIARQGALAPSEAMRLLRDIVDGIAHAHRQGIVHRDIKPDNVMIADRHALVVDFGVAKAMSDATAHHDLTSIGISLGTPAYMAPEQAAADPAIDHRADIYSVGMLAYEMLTGKPPFTGTPQAIIAAQIATAPVPLLTVKPDLPPAVAQIVMRCIEKDPAKRFQTADGLLTALESLVTPSGAVASAAGMAPRPRTRLALGLGVALVLVLGWFGTARVRTDRWVHGTALPELKRLIEAAEQDSAFALARRIEAAAPDDSTLAALWPSFARQTVIRSTPDGVRVFRAPMSDTSQWVSVGTTPTDTLRVPNRVGIFRYEKEGFRTAYTLSVIASVPPLLDSVNAPFPEMVRMPGGSTGTFLVGSDGATPVTLGDYRIDRFEVSNKDYKAFVDAGGYGDRLLWDQPFRDGGRTLAFDEAVRRFVDRTGRPGPATWEGGSYPAGQAEMPVGGVSWYEAMAYAKFAGKSLPTIYHWTRVANVNYSRFVVTHSNMESAGPLAVGTPRGISLGGVSDLAGNVREWIINEAGTTGQHFILGGGWSDPTYAFVDAYAQLPMDRSVINGIRLVRYEAGDTSIVAASRPIPRAFSDYTKETPVADAVFATFRPQFDYDPIALDAKVELRDTTPEQWIAEKVSFSAAYGGERMYAWIFLPKRGTPPYQTVVMFPGSGSIGAAPSTATPDPRISFVPGSGRIAVFPIFKSTHERSDSLRSDVPDKSIFWRDHVVMWVKDYRRTLDYLSTRPEVDTTKFAYFGYSWGGNMGGIIPAVEPRIKATMLYVAGLTMERSRPEVDPFHYLPHIRTPVLMLNGKYDYFFPTETAQKPFFRLLGTAAADKRYIVYEGGHDVPRTQLIAESMAWLDKYLGPVR